MGLILFLLKPLIYAGAFVLGARVFRRYGPHWRLPLFVTIALATVARVGGGVVNAVIAGVTTDASAGDASFLGVTFALGFVLWVGCAWLAFRRAPLVGILVFALVCEAMSAGIDFLALTDMKSSWRIC